MLIVQKLKLPGLWGFLLEKNNFLFLIMTYSICIDLSDVIALLFQLV